MRVVAGSARGHRLRAPEGRDTRPTSDRVREAVFNALGSLDAVEGAVVVDLYAGSGALGIEALSRGAVSATFVDDDARAIAAIGANLAATGLGAAATVVRTDAGGFLSGAPGRFDLAMCDPPYAFDGWVELLDALDAPLAVLESDRELWVPDRWEVLRVRRYGSTVVTFAARR